MKRAMPFLALMLFQALLCAAEGDAPRLGKYNIYSYGRVGVGAPPPLFLGHVELQAGGKYRVSRTSAENYFGEGTYTFDGKAITWVSGPYKDDGFTGTFTIENDGKTHKIRLKPTTVATQTEK